MQKQSLEVFCKNGVLKNFAIFTRKHVLLRPATLFKKRLWHRCFPVNFGKVFKNTSGWLHLKESLFFESYCLPNSS